MNTLRRFDPSMQQRANGSPLAWLVLALIFFSATVQAQLTNGGPALDLSNGSVTVLHAADLNAFPITITAWFRTQAPVPFGGIIGKDHDTTFDGYAIALEGGQISATYGGAAGSSQSVGAVDVDGQWHHFAFVVDASGSRLYVDGALRGSAGWLGTPGPTTTSYALSFGYSDRAGGFRGQIDEVAIWNVAQSQAAIQANRFRRLAGNEAGLISYHPFDEGTGTTVADATGRGHTGTLFTGFTWINVPPSVAGTALRCTTNGAVTVPHNAALNAYPLTVSAWFREMPGMTGYRTIVSKQGRDIYHDQNESGYFLGLTPNFGGQGVEANFVPFRPDGQFHGVFLVDNTPVRDGAWHHAAFTVDSTGGKLYVDGVLRQSESWAGIQGPATTLAPFHIGYHPAEFEYYPLVGDVDEVSLWNTVLSGAAIRTNASRRLVGNEPGLIAYYRLDSAAGTNATDNTGHGYNGVIGSEAVWIASGVPNVQTISGRISPPPPPTLVHATVFVLPEPQAPIAIPDNGIVYATNVVSSVGAIGAVTVAVNLTHTFRGDIELTLIHPDGTEVRLKDPDVHDVAQDVVTTYPSPTRSVGNLGVLNGKSMAGAWRLRVRDAFADDVGTLESWVLILGVPPALSDAAGAFTLSNLFLNTYIVTPTLEGFTFNPASATVIAGATNANFTVVSGSISGRVTALGTGVAGVSVRIGSSTALTDTDGNYRIQALLPGNHTVTASLAGHSFTPVQLTVPFGTTNANFAVSGYPVSGRIVDLRTNGVANILVSASGTALNTRTTNDGTYLITGVPSGDRTITPGSGLELFSPSNHTVTLGPTGATEVDFVLQSTPPTISDITNRVIAKGTSTGPIRFMVDDAETRPGRLQVAASANDTNLVPAGALVPGGVGNDRTLTVTPPPDKAGTTVITVTVTDEAGLSASDSFTLRVNQDPIAGLGLALNFDGVNDQVTVRTNVFGNKGNFTVECWVSAPSNSGPRVLMSQVGGTNTFTISLDPAGIIRVSEMWVTGVPFPFGGWHHLAVVKESADTHLYLDGLRRASYGRPVPFPAQTNRFDIGRGLTAIGLPLGFWLGGIDEVRVWETARSGEEIATYQNVRVTGAETNLSALWRFDERSGATAFDSSRHGWHGEVTGPLRTLASIRFDRYRTAEDVGFADVLQAADLDGDPLTFRMISPPAGMVTVTDTNTGAFTYVPARNASGQDRFTFTVSDGYQESEVSVVTINITADPNPPFLAAIANQSVAEDTRLGPVGFTVSDLEEAATNLTVSGQSDNETLIPNANITFSGTGGSRSFFVLPATNQFGSTTLRIIASDGTLRRTNSFTMTVTPVNDLPQISVLTNQLTQRGVAISQSFTISDVDNSLSDLTVVGAMGFANPPNLIASILATGVSSNRIVTVTPAAGVSGQAPISVIVSDAPQSGGVAQFLLTVNDPPTIAAIPNQSTFRNLATRPIAITVNDVEGDAVTLSASSSNPALVGSGGFAFSGTGINRMLIITPERGQIGAASITVTARDNFWSASQSFTLFIEEGLDYTYVDLPVPAGMESAQALDLNESGLVVGRGLFASFAGSRAVVWDVNSSQPTVRVLANVESDAVAVNSSGQVVGATNGAAVIYQNNTITVLGPGYALDINDAGMVVGVANYLNNTAFFYDGTRQTNFAGVFTSSALYGTASLKLSSRGDVFGISTDNNSALLWQLNGDGSRTLRNLGSFGGGLNSGGFNNVGEVAFTSTQVGSGSRQLLYNHRNNVLVTNLASAFTNAFGNAAELITDLNDASEMVGGRFFPAGQAFLYSGGFVYRLQDLVSTNVFNPVHATGLNRAGDICGWGSKPGSPGTRPFLLRRQWIVGRPQSPPFQAISSTGKAYAPPTVDALDGTDPHQPLAYLWSDVEQKLYFLRPITARVTWYTISDFQNTNPPPPIIRVARVVWPSDPQLHVAGAPVQVEPLHASFPYRAVERSYSTVPGSSLELATKSLRADLPGYTVIRYVIAPEAALGSLPDANTRSNYFQVVRTVSPDDPLVLRDGQLATVGIAVSDPRGLAVSTNSPKSGWVVNALSFYDGVGADAAYDRTTQTGPIIPVNRDAAGTGDDLLVAFYKVNPLTGALWPDLTARFNVQWPTNAEKLVIANPLGSGPLSASQYPEKRVYVQNDRSLPGFNPNEEHAFLAPSSAGEGVFALRNDLNSGTTSSNFVLLKYRAPASGEWRMKLYQVVLLDAEHDFVSGAEAGKELQAPDPLISFPLCTGSNQTRAVFGRAYKDHRGKFYARQGPTPSDLNPQVVMNYFYELQPGFYISTNTVAGTCVEWRGIAPGASTAAPVDVTFRIRWPANSPTLQIGETLLDPKRELPGIRDFASATVAFDSLNPDGDMPLSATARLYDPVSARVLPLTNIVSASYRFPPEIALETTPTGKQRFSGLAFHLRSRLLYDPLNKTLSFHGIIDESGLGEPLLLVNVMSSLERDHIKRLSNEGRFHNLIDALYDLTRNPNRIDADPRDGQPDQKLLIGFTTNSAGHVIQEPLGDLPKALTAGLPLPGASASFGRALQLDGADDWVSTSLRTTAPQTFTLSAWFKTTSTNLGILIGFGDQAVAPSGARDRQLWVDGQGRVSFYLYDFTGHVISSLPGFNDANWHHAAASFSTNTGMRLYVDGSLVASNTAVTFGYVYPGGGYWRIGTESISFFRGEIDDLQVWDTVRTAAQIQSDKSRPLTGSEPGLASYWRFDESSGTNAFDSTDSFRDGTLRGGATNVSSTIPASGSLARYIVLAENDNPALGALSVTLHVIRVDGGPFRGDLKIIKPDNVFDERLTLRHSSDFGGDPNNIQFEWWYHPDGANFDPTALPVVNAAGAVTDTQGWRAYRAATHGQHYVTLGEGGESSLFTLLDNWFVVRYRGYNIGGQTNWSNWIGDPASAAQTRAAFAPGWVKRVIEGINPFEARTTNFHETPASTYASMLIQAGERYEGNIALNPDGQNLNEIGLIEAYTTVLNRGKNLSIDGVPPVDLDPANNALLFAASRISDLYMLIGNEAFADAQDPTIGFFSDSLEFGTVATSIFAFKNQLDSLLEEELALLRGRDDSAAGVGARPVYNRLLWNFTGAEGEVAYERAYNVGDVNLDGVINENDARILFPQGHGDAWGHYLTAIKTYYELLRHPRFTWIPRTETVLIAGTAVRVDFLDERKFASIAAAKAKAGAEIVDLTYRQKYVDDPEGQYQGYKDTQPERAWGVSEWATRAGQAAYFDWLVGNAVLPSVDPNTNHVGLQKIDRQTVQELEEIVVHHRQVQAQIDKVDIGLNPLGLAKGVVPFDVDPSLLLPSVGLQAVGHFEQIYQRAVQAMNNTVTMWNQANSLTEALRRQQDTVDEFTANTADQERDFKSRLIEVFGYPYSGDIGAGKTYPSGYDGPDIYHFHYVNATELTGQQPSPRGFSNVIGYFKPFQDGNSPPSFYFNGDVSTTNFSSASVLAVNFPLASGDWAFTAPAEYGSRRAPGEIQLTVSDLLQEETRLKQALSNYEGLIQQIEDMSQLLQSRMALSNRVIQVLTSNQSTQQFFNARIHGAVVSQLTLRRISSVLSRVAETLVAAIPDDIADAIIPVDNIAQAAYIPVVAISEGFEVGADIAEGVQNRAELDKEEAQLQSDIDVEVATQDFEVRQMAAELRQLLRSEAPMRLEAFNQAELVRQSFSRYLAAVAAGQRLLTERTVFRQRTAGLAQQNRYKDAAFRIFRNEALQKYRAQFDLAARYVYLAAAAYDYELNFLGSDPRAARDFFTDIVRERSLGVMVDEVPITGRTGLSDPLARLKQNFEVLSPRFGLNNPQQETARFSLRKELFRIRDGSSAQWESFLRQSLVPDLWQVPEFRRYCRPFAPEAAGPQPGLVLRFPTTVTFGLNFFGHALGAGDSAYDPSLFSTKINAVGLWFSNYVAAGLATAPRVYFFPAGMDVLRTPTGNTLATREWKVLDQVVPVPFPIGASDLGDPAWIPQIDTLAGSFAQIRRYSSFRAYHDEGVYDDIQSTKDTRLVGRSVWNTDWVLIIPGGTFLSDPNLGLKRFIESVDDILISLQSYSYPGD